MGMRPYQLFSGDGSRQRAESFACKRPGWRVLSLCDEIDPQQFRLDAFGRDENGVAYQYVVLSQRSMVARNRKRDGAMKPAGTIDFHILGHKGE